MTQEIAGALGLDKFGAFQPALRGDTLAITSNLGLEVWKKADGIWSFEKGYSVQAEGCTVARFHDDALTIGCGQADNYKGAVYYLTCPDAFTAAAADGGSAAASGGKCIHFYFQSHHVTCPRP